MLVVAGFGSSCSEDVTQVANDQSEPQVRIAFPPGNPDALWPVVDSIGVYVSAVDDQALAGVFLWSLRENGVQRLVGESAVSIQLSEIPPEIVDEVSVPAGWDLFAFSWYTIGFANGERPSLFATALDEADNLSRANPVRVVIRNTEGSVPPVPDFVASPPRANVGDEVCFDPGRTMDAIDPPQNVTIRWDFEGDGRWDVDWDAGATVLDIQCTRYALPGEYRVMMQARNSYFEQPSPVETQVIVISSDCGGPPDPPEGMPFERVEPGVYTIGSDPLDPLTDGDEFPRFRARLPLPVMIQRYETTNDQYISFLSEQYAEGALEIVEQSVRLVATSPDSSWVYVDLDNSRIYFDIDINRFDIEPGFEDHPVTGVSWYGADAFARRYCLRLPTEAEWEVAARGDSLAWRFPFGRSITTGDESGVARVNYVGNGDPFEESVGTTPVGFWDGRNEQGFGTIDTPSYFGAYDLAGNVAEWVFDWYGEYRPGERTNPQGPPTGTFKVVRGGSYLSSWDGVRVTARDGDRTPAESFATIGFRTAFTVLD